MKNIKRFLCLLLTMLLLLEYIPGVLPASAAQEDGICELHHPAHDVSVCGYVAEVQGVPCNHMESCDDACKQQVTNCSFDHTDCGCTDETACDHQCTVDSGCVSLVCSHKEHDSNCGYVEAVTGVACSFAGKECAQCAETRECDENCMNPGEHEGECTLYCEVEYCAKAQGHEDPCAMACGCPVTVPEHLETCDRFVPYSQTQPMYARITGSDGNGNETVNYLESMSGSAGSVGPWMTLVPSQESNVGFTGFFSSNTEVVSLEYVNDDEDNSAFRFVFGKAGTATITHQEDATTYSFTVTVTQPEYRMIPVQPEGNRNWIDLNGLTGPVNLRCYLAFMNGGPTGNPLTTVRSSDQRIFTLSEPDQNGVYTLTPVNPGKAQLVYQAGDRTYTCDVTVMDKTFRAEGLLYFPDVHWSGKTFPCTAVNIPAEGGIAREFFYSQPAEAALLAEGEDSGLTPLTIHDVTWSGPIDVKQPEGDTRLHIIGTGVGTGYLEVTSTDGIVHCFVVNVGRDRPNTEVQEGGYMWLDQDTVLGFGNPGIASEGDNNAEEGVLKLRAQVNNGFGSDHPEDYRFREPVAFAAMDQTNGKPDATVMAAVKNVRFSILACQNTDGTAGSYASVEKAQCEQVELSEGNIKAWTNYIVAGGTDAFKGVVGMSFDLPDTKGGESITRRMSLYILMHNTYMGEEVRVEANVTSAKQLNVILSSYEALKTWIKLEHPEYADTVDQACNVDLKLPGVDLTDAVVVYDAIAPFPFRPNPSSNPNFRVYMMAPTQGQKTTMAGLISRGSLAGIFDVNFVADSDITMTLGEERFTCGLMADSTWSGEVEYDMEFAAKYGIDPTANKRNLSSWTGDGGMKHADCDILSVDGCSFEGFDYGTRSTPNGYVGGGNSNSFSKCYFGIYIDCEGKPGWGDIHYTGFSGYDFKKNVVAVRIVGLQNNITPYEFRIHDSDFINNYLEFWIDKYNTTYLQNYYFYRNHYSGGWDKPTGNWYKYGSSTLGNETIPAVDHRGPKYSEEMNNGVDVIVSGTPGRATPNLLINSSTVTEGYWIYDGEDQVTRIEKGGDSLPLAQESLESLKQDADVSVVENQGADTFAVWTFEGGE